MRGLANQDPDRVPVLSADLIDQLDKQIPEKCPSPAMSDREIWMYAGKRELIRSLLVKVNAGNENPLEIETIRKG